MTTLSAFELFALSKIKSPKISINPGVYTVPPFTVRVSGGLKIHNDYTTAPTVRIPLLPALALAIKKMGIQREHFMEVLREAMNEALIENIAVRDALADEVGLIAFEQEFHEKVIAKLPRIPHGGSVVAALEIEKIEG